MSQKIDKAFILGAGFGTRLRPYTDQCPKPMVQVAGRSLIWRCLDKLCAAGVKKVVVNTHYLADTLHDHLHAYEGDLEVVCIYEPEILDTGGGVKNALGHFDGAPFFVIAGDNLWSDGAVSGLDRLSQSWDAKKMDILTLLQPIDQMKLTHGVGDYDLMESGLIKRSLDKRGTHMWTNIRINTPNVYNKLSDTEFSFLKIMDDCERKGRLYALEHDGEWHHISTPQDLEAVDVYFRAA